jgi:hypothetical protein
MVIVLFSLAAIISGIGFLLENGMIVSGIFALIVAVVLTIAIVDAHSEADYKAMAIERKTLVCRLAVEGTSADLREEIDEFNHELWRTKQDAESLFTNWVTNQKVAALDFIEIAD